MKDQDNYPYQGRSKEQVERNNKATGYTLVFGLMCLIISLIVSQWS